MCNLALSGFFYSDFQTNPLLMKRLIFCNLLLFALCLTTSGQTAAPSSEVKKNKDEPAVTPPEKKPPLFGIKFSGYVKTDIFYDTRQTCGLRDGHFLLYPEPVKPDADGKDINAKSAYNILSIQTRLAGSM